MDPTQLPGAELWQEAAAGVQSWLDADLRADAYEVFVAEAARCRLVDRVGDARVTLGCGVVIQGELAPDAGEAVDEHLVLHGAGGVVRLVPVSAVVSVRGSRAGLRAEGDRVPRSLTSWLREAWSAEEPLRLLDGSGRWTVGRLCFVGADHIELDDGEDPTVVPLTTVEAWQRG
jgi:hypothetical protein